MGCASERSVEITSYRMNGTNGQNLQNKSTSIYVNRNMNPVILHYHYQQPQSFYIYNNGRYIVQQTPFVFSRINYNNMPVTQIICLIRANNYNLGYFRGANMIIGTSTIRPNNYQIIYNYQNYNNNHNNLSSIRGIKIERVKENIKEECTICCENFQKNEDILYLPCKHCFHPLCIKEWFNNKKECPLCRKEF